MFAIVFKLIVAGHVFFMPGHSRFMYGEQCEAHLVSAAKSVIPRDAIRSRRARVISTHCEIMRDDVRS